jgi:ethanolamine utilization protein EutP
MMNGVHEGAVWRFMLWGGVGAGKTTLLKALTEESEIPVRKTQMVDYSNWGIDTPGEYSEMGHLRRHLVSTACDAHLLVVVHDATRDTTNFPPNYFLMFPQGAIGVVTKIDIPTTDTERATAILRQIGVLGDIFYVSAITGSGLSELRQNLIALSRKE